MTFMFEFTIGFKVRFEFTVWISKLWSVDITIKIMTVGSKKKKWSLIRDIDSTASIRSPILVIRWSETSIRSPILVIRWSETSIRRRSSETSIRWRSSKTSIRRRSSETSIRRRSSLLQQSAHRWWGYNGRRHQSGGPSNLHHKRLYWPSHRCW